MVQLLAINLPTDKLATLFKEVDVNNDQSAFCLSLSLFALSRSFVLSLCCGPSFLLSF
jgi:hypothetical protein